MNEPPSLTDSAKNELIGRLKAASKSSASASASKPTPNAQDENRALFISAMSDPVRRQIAFNVVERNCRDRFSEGADGVQLYVRLLTYVRLTNAAEAVDEFERRFRPMLDQDALEEWQRITASFKRQGSKILSPNRCDAMRASPSP